MSSTASFTDPAEYTRDALVMASTSADWPSTMAAAHSSRMASVIRSLSPEEVISQSVILPPSMIASTFTVLNWLVLSAV